MFLELIYIMDIDFIYIYRFKNNMNFHEKKSCIFHIIQIPVFYN